jgi:hypothetical protein
MIAQLLHQVQSPNRSKNASIGRTLVAEILARSACQSLAIRRAKAAIAEDMLRWVILVVDVVHEKLTVAAKCQVMRVETHYSSNSPACWCVSGVSVQARIKKNEKLRRVDASASQAVSERWRHISNRLVLRGRGGC